MDKNKQTIIVLLCLIAVAGFIFLPGLMKKKPKASAAAMRADKSSAIFDRKKLAALVAADKETTQEFVNKDWGLRDPFNISALKASMEKAADAIAKDVAAKVAAKPVEKDAPKKKPLVLTGVLWGTGRPSAIINDKALSVGETIEGLTIKAITESAVVLTDGSEDTVLTMWQ